MVEPVPSYCRWVRELPPDAELLHRHYHDTAYGFPLHTDVELFGRLLLEINQAGLSWTTILRKQEHFQRAYHQFDIDRIAAFGEADRLRLLDDPGIIRNRRKIEAAIYNARILQSLRTTHGSFRQWLCAHHPRSREEWTRLFRSTFHFTGGEIVSEFLMSTGFLPGAHDEDCPVYSAIRDLSPPWMEGTPER